jgi:Monooxygenase af470-like
MIHHGRFRADIGGDFVVFLIGAHLRRLWKPWHWVPVARAMARMQKEIGRHPEIGCLHIDNYGGFRNVSVQYWRSVEHLERFARSDEWAHLPAWRSFNRLVRDSGDVGIWHETYPVAAGTWETFYGDMPATGLAGAGRVVAAGRSS